MRDSVVKNTGPGHATFLLAGAFLGTGTVRDLQYAPPPAVKDAGEPRGALSVRLITAQGETDGDVGYVIDTSGRWSIDGNLDTNSTFSRTLNGIHPPGLYDIEVAGTRRDAQGNLVAYKGTSHNVNVTAGRTTLLEVSVEEQ